MRAKSRLHYHSDCDFFAGCENMLVNFFGDARLLATYDVSFSCRWSAQYEEGLRRRVAQAPLIERPALLSGTLFTRHAARLPRPLAVLLRGLNYLLLVRYWVLLWNALVLYRAWRGRGIDLLHINNGGYPAALSCLSAAIAAKWCGIPRVLMVVNNIAQQGRYRYWWLDRPLDHLVGNSVDVFVTGSSHAGGVLRSVLRLPQERFRTLHNGIAARGVTETPAATRARLGVAPDQMVFGMVALLEWRKGHRVLLEAVARLPALLGEREMPLFLIEGDGPDRDELARLVQQLQLARWVRFIGVESHVFNFVVALDVMLLPSVANEDFPNVILEAMSLGKAVIASSLAGTPEQIDEAITGALVPPGNSVALAQQIATFVGTQCQIPMGMRARARFEQEFTASAAVARYMKLYESLLNRRMN
ncbi:glycosyltransferase family 4 protein [Massilia sp. TWP1-3-3]|uniref:glycosyltransferase family 4 protein n=1 Tax=Massilia sp. TWP1-3-3 TaxID=2804573 RepID=UPI003CF3ECD4